MLTYILILVGIVGIAVLKAILPRRTVLASPERGVLPVNLSGSLRSI